jgi:hypothetical protein
VNRLVRKQQREIVVLLRFEAAGRGQLRRDRRAFLIEAYPASPAIMIANTPKNAALRAITRSRLCASRCRRSSNLTPAIAEMIFSSAACLPSLSSRASAASGSARSSANVPSAAARYRSALGKHSSAWLPLSVAFGSPATTSARMLPSPLSALKARISSSTHLEVAEAGRRADHDQKRRAAQHLLDAVGKTRGSFQLIAIAKDGE